MKMKKIAVYVTALGVAAAALSGCSTVKKYAVTSTAEGTESGVLSLATDTTSALVPDVTSVPELTETPTPTPTETPTPTPTETPTPTPELPKIIGTQAEGDSIIVIELQNSTGRNITSFQVKDANMGPEGLSDNMLADTWKTDETRILYFDTANYQNGTMWNVRVVFEGSENGSTITNYPFTDMKSGIFNYSQDGYLYVSFHSTSTDTDTDTLEKEKSWHSAAGTNAG